MRMSKKYDLLTSLLITYMNEIVPFLILFILWNYMFALQYYLLGTDIEEIQPKFEGTSIYFAYFLNTFENSIGSIQSPTLEFWKKNSPYNSYDIVILHTIWIIWFLN